MNRAAVVWFALLSGSSILAAQTTMGQPGFATQGMAVIQKTSPASDGPATWATGTSSPAQAPAGVALQMSEMAQPMNGCPVTLRAGHNPGGDTMEVNGVRTGSVAQMLHLSVANRDSRPIVAANVTVHGLANKPRLTKTQPDHNTADAAKTLDVQFAAGTGKEVAADLTVPGLSAATAIELNSVTYADGSTWKLAGSFCRAPIDGVMRIGDR